MAMEFFRFIFTYSSSALVFILLSLYLPSTIYAVTLTVTSNKDTLTLPDADEIQANIFVESSVKNGTVYYLRGAFHKPGSSEYCGSTWNGSVFYTGSVSGDGCKNLLPITIQSSTWSGELRSRFDQESSACRDSGEYHLKVFRYPESCNAGSDTVNELLIHVVVPTSIPTPTLTPTCVPTVTMIPTIAVSSTPIPTNTQVLQVTSQPTSNETPVGDQTRGIVVLPSPRDTSYRTLLSIRQDILGIQTETVPHASATDSSTQNDSSYARLARQLAGSLAFVGLGMGILTGVSLWKTIGHIHRNKTSHHA